MDFIVKIFVNGTFDILHPGHMALFEYAKSQGDYLKVAIDTDERIKANKGFDRPINNQDIRRRMLECIKFIDEVSLFGTDDELTTTVKEYGPDLMIVGSDYVNKRVIGSEYAKELFFFERDARYSSTKIIEYINNR
jgi:D-beta-D-heptose 7-phosphate kinase/D-beta-D-heptose 1-phosphate adenosyltransferase